MPIYGRNFNGTDIPAEAIRLFRYQRRRVQADCSCQLTSPLCNRANHSGKAQLFFLVGVCNTIEERNDMLIQADNGHRRLHVVAKRQWFAIYAG